MTMTLDPNSQRFGPLNYAHMSSFPPSQPHFTNPWSAPASSGVGAPNAAHSMYAASSSQPGLSPNPLSLDTLTKHHHQPQQQQHHQHQQQQPHHVSRTSGGSAASISSYGSVPVTSAPAGSPHSMAHSIAALTGGPQDLLSSPQDLLSLGRMAPVPTSAGYGDASYTSASPIHPTYAATSQAPYESMGRYAHGSMQPAFTLASDADNGARRYSQTSIPHHDDRGRFADALEASQGMLSMSQETPRNIYGPPAGGRSRGSADAYGFPATHSTSSSVSSSSGFGYYGGGSIDSSVSDYSTAGSDIESVASRTLPRPQGLMGGGGSQVPPAPQSMMGQFSSKVSSSTQKKHKCKVCDKRFTRPSSLQTHMYSHTGEKPFQCEVEGCGRHFSVVSNLRRHRKVHKGDARSEAGSEDHQSD